ncbi:MAG: hypothetical protein Q8O34_06070, partial [Rhodocyclaceae bacterium]|nr:hypothetical protein [Rhodocyclaceae bacterium]
MSRNNTCSLKSKKNQRTIADDSDSDETFSDCSYDSENETLTASESEVEEKEIKIKKEKIKKEVKREKAPAVKKIKTDASKSKNEKPDQFSKKSHSSPKKKRKVDEVFDDTDVSIDMSKDAVKLKKIKLTSNLLLVRRMVNVNEGGRSCIWLLFRKMKDSKASEFNLPITISETLINAVRALNV